MRHRRDRHLVVGRERELAVLARVLDEDGPRICFVYGMAGIGKSALLDRFRDECGARGVPTSWVDCRSIDPTETGFLEALAAVADIEGQGPLAAPERGGRAVLIVDTYEVFRIGDPWLRQELLAALGPSVAVVIAGRDAPMLEWSIDRGQLGGLEVLPLGPLADDATAELLEAAGVADEATAAAIGRATAGHPLALRLALEAQLAARDLPVERSLQRVVDALATAFRAGLDDESKRALDAAAVPRTITQGVMSAMLGSDADQAMEVLAGLSFVEPTGEGLRLHDAVHTAIAERLRAADPAEFRRLRTAAWRHACSESRSAGSREVARSTADLLFLIDNPVVREAMFPTTAHSYSVERSRPADEEALRSLWHRYDSPEGANALDRWLRLAPGAVRSVRDRTGTVVGCSIVAAWADIPASLERDDPVLAAWARHAAQHPLPAGQRTIVHRRVLSEEAGEGPSPAQAAAWLDVKGIYFRLRPHVGRLYGGAADPQPFLAAMLTLGFRPFEQPIVLGDHLFHAAVIDFGPDSIDGWLSRLAANELGIAEVPFLDPADRTVDVQGVRVSLSPLEFGVLEALAARPGRPVSRVDVLAAVWGTSYAGGSNVVDVIVRGLRQKLGADGRRLETVRGVGYRLC